jgi:branched-subunit amino acid transport protein
VLAQGVVRMSLDLVLLAILMGAVTYPSRAVPMLAPGIARLPPVVLLYLRLVGPAVLMALAAVNVLVLVDADGRSTVSVGLEAVAVIAAIAVVAWRRNLFLGLLVAVLLVALARAAGAA